MKRILVTGATGFIGYEVARQLAHGGLRPRLMVRRPLRGPLLTPMEAEVVQADLTRPASLDRATEGVDTVLHLAARASLEDYAVLRPTIVDGSLALMRSAVAAGAQRFVYASSLLVYDSQSRLIDEHTPTGPRCGYGRAKLEAEERLSQLAHEAGLDFATLRLPHVYGARDLLFERIRHRRLILPGGGENLMAHLHVEDAARALIAVAEQGWSGTTAVADDLAASWNEFFAVLREYYPRVRTRQIPQWFALLGTGALRPLQRLRSAPSLHTPAAVAGWNCNLPVQPGLLWREIGLQPRYPTIRQGIPAALDELVAFRWIHPLYDLS